MKNLILFLALFVFSLLGDNKHRAWQTFHVNWVFFTGLTFGSIVITAVHNQARCGPSRHPVSSAYAADWVCTYARA